jgi:hypothetical protein
MTALSFITIPRLLIICMVAMLSGFEANASQPQAGNSVAASEPIWNQIFGSTPTVIDAKIFLRLLNPNRSCKLADDISQMMANYRLALSSNHTTATQAATMAESLKAQALRLYQLPPSNCRDIALTVYATESVALLSGFYSLDGDARKADSSELTVTKSLPFFTAAAILKGSLSLKTHNDRGVGKKSVLGTYVCSSAQMNVDPVQEPLNLAATITHELSHLFLDKLSYLNSEEVSHGKARPGDFSKFILLEESFAALYAGALQRSFANEYLAPQLKGKNFSDLSFYSVSGPLEQISRLVESVTADRSAAFTAVGIAAFFGSKDWILDFQPANFTAAQVIPGGMRTLQLVQQYDTEIKTARNSLYQKLSKTYFQKTLASSEFELLEPQQVAGILSFQSTQNPVLFAVGFDSIMAPQNRLAGPVRIIHGQARAEIPLAAISAKTSNGKNIDLSVSSRMLRLLQDPYFLEKSRLCNRFETSVETGELDGYLGTKMESHSTYLPPMARPSEKGVRPAEKGVRPCILIGDRI